jgi:FlaA1/EpsC-like NDP-sugar epimerase
VTVVGFLDDNTDKYRMHIHGIPVLGSRYDIPYLAQQHNIQQVIIAIASAPGKVVREIVHLCEQAEVDTKIIPGLHEMLDGKVRTSQLRDVQIEDLLRRAPVQTDVSAVGAMIRGKRVLITGGGGSIGSELCRQVLHCEPAQLIILGHGENSVFDIHNELQRMLLNRQNGSTSTYLDAVIADVRFADRLHTIFQTYRPQIVFHAAAHKHVPLMETNPVEAITNNVIGTQNLLAAAHAADTEHFVMISTDKAVNPTSIMGASKRVAELLVHRAAMVSGRPYVAVRFGNVLGSRGSVVLTFKQQIAMGGPITVTHPEMRRYFMTIPEAVQLVMQAATLGKGGEVFTLDMGEPIKIADLARDMIELSGLEVGHDIDIVFTGSRPGEKLYEELFVPGEEYYRTQHEKIFIARNASTFVTEDLDEALYRLFEAAQQNDITHILRALHILIPQLQHELLDQEYLHTEIEPLQVKVVGG